MFNPGTAGGSGAAQTSSGTASSSSSGAVVGGAAGAANLAPGGVASTVLDGSVGPSSSNRREKQMQTLQSLLHMRSEMAILKDLKVGPMLGRGSYGRVHRAKWKSAVVAVKIIEHHGEGSRVSSGGKRVNVSRESLLSTSMSHPNVVQTYHISTMTVAERAALARKVTSRRRLLEESPEPKPRLSQDERREEQVGKNKKGGVG